MIWLVRSAADDFYSTDHGDYVRGGGVGELFVGLFVGIPIVIGIEAIDALRRWKDRCRGARAAMRRWPMPVSLGVLTNDELDDVLKGSR